MRFMLLHGSMLLGAAACIAPRDVDLRAGEVQEHGTTGLTAEQRAELWISYQIEVTAIDGAATAYRAQGECVYFPVTLPPGEHELALRLSYSTPLHHIATSESQPLLVRLEADRAYRVLDLSAGEEGARRFTPWLVEGAPERGAAD